MSKNDVDGLSEKNLVDQIESTEVGGEIVSTILKTDERVIARVTDGIYRQPGSALRELISNAYDADATKVVIKTDAPRFDVITIEDNGLGMTPKALAHMLLHIGGSAKRQTIGKKLGITNANDSLLSPSGRKLIGKIGIGIFSVSQLTHTFQIITKTRGDQFRTIATVALKQYADDTNSEDYYESGKVKIWRERATDLNVQGTTIILNGIKPQARDTLRSKETWDAIAQSNNSSNMDELQPILPPKFHIGQVDKTGNELIIIDEKVDNLPWEQNDSGKVAFQKLVKSTWDEYSSGNLNPQLGKIFDNYLQMIWTISLSIPLSYVEGHLFDTEISNSAIIFSISNQPKGGAQEVKLSQGVTIREKFKLIEGSHIEEFAVFIDNLELSRPIRFKNLPTSSHAIKKPMVFIGNCEESFSAYPRELSGGPLAFEAYLFWNPKIAPTEHQGSLIRIHGASGTLFDPSFMRYQVSELTRLKQITCEIFIHQGFDSALNIDRESFNHAHPHAVFLSRWLHSAIRQLATAQKRVANDLRTTTRNEAKNTTLNEIQKIAHQVWHEQINDDDLPPPSILMENSKNELPLNYHPEFDIVYNRAEIIPQKKGKTTKKSTSSQELLDERIKAIAQVLASFRLLEKLDKQSQERLLKAIYQILETSK